MALKGTELAKAQVTTIRTKLFKIAARVTVSVRRIVFHLSSSCPYQQLFALLVRRLTSIYHSEREMLNIVIPSAARNLAA